MDREDVEATDSRSKKKIAKGFKFKEPSTREDRHDGEDRDGHLDRGYRGQDSRDKERERDRYRNRDSEDRRERGDRSYGNHEERRRSREKPRQSERSNGERSSRRSPSPRRAEPAQTEPEAEQEEEYDADVRAKFGDVKPRRPNPTTTTAPGSGTGGEVKTKKKKDKDKDKPSRAAASTSSEPMIIVNINDRLGTKAAIPCLASDPIRKFLPSHFALLTSLSTLVTHTASCPICLCFSFCSFVPVLIKARLHCSGPRAYNRAHSLLFIRHSPCASLPSSYPARSLFPAQTTNMSQTGLFKAQVAARIGREPHEIMLKRQGERPFKDHLTLEDYGVSNGVQLDLEVDTGD